MQNKIINEHNPVFPLQKYLINTYCNEDNILQIKSQQLAVNSRRHTVKSTLCIFLKIICQTFIPKYKQETQGPHHSPEKTVQINKHI